MAGPRAERPSHSVWQLRHTFWWAPPRKHALTGDDWSSCLGHCNRHQRRLLTEELGRLWAKRGQEVSCSALRGLWRPPQPCFPRRAPRRLFAKQRANWGDHRSGRRQLWSGWPERGRIGEAANPGPPAPSALTQWPTVGGDHARLNLPTWLWMRFLLTLSLLEFTAPWSAALALILPRLLAGQL